MIINTPTISFSFATNMDFSTPPMKMALKADKAVNSLAAISTAAFAAEDRRSCRERILAINWTIFGRPVLGRL